MTDIFRTIIVPAAELEEAREHCGECGETGMFTAGLSPTGEAPATHYVSSGWMPEELLEHFPDEDPENPRDGDPHALFESLGLKLIQA